MSDGLNPRQRYLLNAAADGRVWLMPDGRYLLDQKSNCTVEFKPLLRRGLTKAPTYASGQPQKVLWFSDEVQKSWLVSS